MKCKVCRGHAVVDIRRHNAAFCPSHFLDHFRGQIAKTIKHFKMFAPDDRLLIAVSGGKDSLALWDVLLDLEYDATGFYLDLGIGGYSTRSKEAAVAFADARDAKLIVRSLEDEHGYSVPELAKLTKRVACSGCGLSKRYEFNRVAQEEGFDILVTGHNLDDEVATLFANVLHWNVDMLGRQSPVLHEKVITETDTRGRLVKKVKPLVRLAERETAAYAVIKGIDYVIEECPMVEGNTLNRYKDAVTLLEETSPGTKQQMYFGFLDRAAERFRDDDAVELVGCVSCGAPTVARPDIEPICSFCRTKNLALDRKQRARKDPSRS